MIIQAKQAFEVRDKNLGILSLRYNEIRTNVSEEWKNNSFFASLLADGLVIFYEDTKDSTVEGKEQEAAEKAANKEAATELDRLLDEAKNKAIHDAEEVAITQGFDKTKAEKVKAKYIKQYQAEAKEKYEAEKNSEVNEGNS